MLEVSVLTEKPLWGLYDDGGDHFCMCEVANLGWVGLPADIVLCEFIWLFRNSHYWRR